ncbi:hypothetical protein OIU77_020151 [Salix suchowensis]|uniref:Uncharacterized protein n=1 Tax=Salix suchowensis TaxID=1278906 RepID=A0ABQ9CMR4_9ROSI|nr:hypothetical protein OIU77_020151 [Salix suchowensis]
MVTAMHRIIIFHLQTVSDLENGGHHISTHTYVHKVRACPQATGGQTWLLYGALALIALGTGGIKPCVSIFGADQLDEADKKEVPKKYAFFNWFFLAINMGVLFGAMVISIVILVADIRFYRFQKPMGSPFTRFAQVLWAAVRNHLNSVRAGHQTEPYEVHDFQIKVSWTRQQLWQIPRLTLETAGDFAHSQPSSSAKQTSWTDNSVPTSQFQQILSPSSASSTPSFLCSAEVFTYAGQLECFLVRLGLEVRLVLP